MCTPGVYIIMIEGVYVYVYICVCVCACIYLHIYLSIYYYYFYYYYLMKSAVLMAAYLLSGRQGVGQRDPPAACREASWWH